MRTRLKKIMLDRGINARRLAIEANLGPSFVYDLLSGKSTNPTFSRIKSIAKILNVNPSYILSGDGVGQKNLITIKYVKLTTQDGCNQIHFEDNKKLDFDKDLFNADFNYDIENLAIYNCENRLRKHSNTQELAIINLGFKSVKKNDTFLCYDGNSLMITDNASNVSICDKYKLNQKLSKNHEIIGKIILTIQIQN